MQCFLATGVQCPLTQAQQADLFEIHVTIAATSEQRLATFRSVCTQHHCKAIVIALDPSIPIQPMTCSRVTGTFDDAWCRAEAIRVNLEAANLYVTRVKIEAAPWNSHVPQTDASVEHQHGSAYFEYHAKLLLSTNAIPMALTDVCQAFGAHLSRYVLKQRNDGGTERFVTLRVAQIGRTGFAAQAEILEQALRDAGVPILTTVTEYCMYDSNSALDAVWLMGHTITPSR